MKKFLLYITFVLMAEGSFAQSNYPICQGSDASRWSICIGSWTDKNSNNYVGAWKDGKFDGKGTYSHANGDRYVGEWRDGKINGKGTYTFANGNRYIGEWKDGKYNGQGTLSAPDGKVVSQGLWANNVLVRSESIQESTKEWIADTKNGCKVFNPNPVPNESVEYIGNCPNGIAQGVGILAWYQNGVLTEKVEGVRKDGKLNGPGILTYLSGDKYVGEWRNDKFNGQGTLYSSDGSIKNQGIWADHAFVRSESIQQPPTKVGDSTTSSNFSVCQGSDVSKWSSCFGGWTASNANRYVGEWRDGKFNGQGVFLSLAENEFKGDKYFGEFKDGLRSGQGTYTHANGNRYLGEWRDGKINGKGTYTFTNGDKYFGELKDGVRNGQGTYTFANGNRYIGEWKDGKYNGQGTLSAPDGKVVSQGLWANNVLVSSESTQQASAQVTNANITKPSFDCAKAKSLAENLICSDSQLSQLDSQLAITFKQAKEASGNSEEFKENTKNAWLYRERNCENKECLINWYASRNEYLNRFLNGPKVIKNVNDSQTLTHKNGLCSGYHQFWSIVSYSSKNYKGFNLSQEVVGELDKKYGGSSEYQKIKIGTTRILTEAYEAKNFTRAKQFEGICVELKLPIGQDTGN